MRRALEVHEHSRTKPGAARGASNASVLAVGATGPARGRGPSAALAGPAFWAGRPKIKTDRAPSVETGTRGAASLDDSGSALPLRLKVTA